MAEFFKRIIKKVDFNLPFDKIHHGLYSWAWLLLPLGYGWLVITKSYGLRFAKYGTFHNTRIYGD